MDIAMIPVTSQTSNAELRQAVAELQEAVSGLRGELAKPKFSPLPERIQDDAAEQSAVYRHPQNGKWKVVDESGTKFYTDAQWEEKKAAAKAAEQVTDQE